MPTENLNQLTLFADPTVPADLPSADPKPADAKSADLSNAETAALSSKVFTRIIQLRRDSRLTSNKNLEM